MAHWIISDYGFGGSCYKCSRCGDSWNDIYEDVSMKDKCPTCGYPMNEENEYVEMVSYSTRILQKPIPRTSESETIRKYEKQVATLIKVSGFDVEKLIELFAAGYTLQPPKYNDLTVLQSAINDYYARNDQKGEKYEQTQCSYH